MSFEYPWLLGVAIALPIVVGFVLWGADRRRRARIARLGDPSVVSRLMPAMPSTFGISRRLSLAGACALCGIAIAGPRWGVERTSTRARGFDMVLALDASLSMLATDERPNRLERMKQEVRRLRAMSSGDRIGLIVFAGRSYVLSPLTVDDGALDLFLDNLDPSVVGQAGSSLSKAIRQGTDLLSLGTGVVDRALVVMSDGEAFEPPEDIVAEARHAGAEHINLVTVGFGTVQGSTIPIRTDNGATTLKRDENGQTVVTRYTPDLLRAAAEAAHGTFVQAGETDKAARVRQALSTLRTQQRTIVGGEMETPRYQLFLLPAILLLLLDTFRAAGARWRRRSPRAAATIVALSATVGTLGCAARREALKASDAYRAGRFGEAVSLYRRAISDGDGRPETMYDFGTSLLRADSTRSAAEALERASTARDPELRYRALFNLGLAHLRRGITAGDQAGKDDLDGALAAYRKVLLSRNTDLDAKWNYELALRKKQDGGGGGGSGASRNPSPTPAPRPSGGLGQSQAEQLLASAAREERAVQAKRQRNARVDAAPHGKDW